MVHDQMYVGEYVVVN